MLETGNTFKEFAVEFSRPNLQQNHPRCLWKYWLAGPAPNLNQKSGDRALDPWAWEATLHMGAHWSVFMGKASAPPADDGGFALREVTACKGRKASCVLASSKYALHSSLPQRTKIFDKGKWAPRERFRPRGLQLRFLDYEGGLRSGADC